MFGHQCYSTAMEDIKDREDTYRVIALPLRVPRWRRLEQWQLLSSLTWSSWCWVCKGRFLDGEAAETQLQVVGQVRKRLLQ